MFCLESRRKAGAMERQLKVKQWRQDERDEHSDKINPSRVYCHMKNQMLFIINWLQYGKIICTLIKLHWSVKMWFYSVTWE